MAAGNHTDEKSFLQEVMETEGGRLVLQCYGCGTCSGSCPVIDEMEYGPRRILYLIQQNQEAMVLSSKDMWRCVSCYSCANRCPRDIQITDLMADLRRLSLAKGYAHDKEAEFAQAFAETVQMHGRMYEPEVIGRYYARVLDVAGLLGMVPLGIKMLLKGKLPFLPDRLEDPKEIELMGVTDSVVPKIATGLRFSGNSGGKRRPRGAVWNTLAALLSGIAIKLGKGKAS